MPQPSASKNPAQDGFALLVLLAVIGVGSVGILLAVQASLPALGGREAVASRNVTTAAHAARIAYRRNGAFPSDLDALAVAAGMSVEGAWRRDPFGSGQELDYGIVATGARVRSRGLDGQLDTADDGEQIVATTTQLRGRQRLRLRMLRAVLLRSPYRHDDGMTPTDEQRMRLAMRDYATARRKWLTASAPERTALDTTMTDAEATVDALVSTYGMPALPVALTGAGGLMSELSMPDRRSADGRDVPLISNSVVGWVAIGADATGGTSDDM